MPQSLWDMFQPTNAAGDPAGFGDAFTSRSNSLIGLGLGMLAPSNPLRGQSSWGQGLEGFQAGAQLDARTAQAAAQRRQHAADRAQSMAQHARDRAQAQSNFERTFAAGQQSPFSKVAADLGLQPGTPEYVEAAKQYHQPKTEGDWQIVQAPHPQFPGESVPVWANKRTRETKPFAPGAAGPDTAAAADPFTADAGRSVYGVGGDYSTPAPAPGVAPAPSTGGIPPAPPGSDPKEWRKEQTKLLVQQRTAEEARKRAGASIDPVTEDIDRAINQTKQYPSMIAGTFGSLMKNVPGSQAADVGKLVDTIKANASLDKLSQMRAQSPTGASGLGAVTQGEHKLLQDSIGALDQSQTPEQFLFNLDRVKRIRHEIVHGPGTAPPPQFDLPESQRPKGAAVGKPPPPRPGFVKRGYVFKGGDPADENNWAPVR